MFEIRFGSARVRTLVAALGVGALCGCKRVPITTSDTAQSGQAADAPATEPAAVTKSVSLNWEQNYKLTAQGVKGEATFFPTKDTDKPPLKLQAAFSQFPQGTKVKIGDEESTLGDSGYFSTLLDIKPAVLKTSLDDLKGPIDLGFELTIAVPGAQPVSTKLKKQDVKEGVRFALLKARDGGVSFGPGDSASPKPRGVAVVSGYSDLEFLGHASSVLELDWVAIAENKEQPRATKTCSYKEGPSTLKIMDADVTIYDRRTAAKLAQTVLEAKSDCPMFAFIDKSDNSSKNTVDQNQVVAWVRSEFAKTQ